MSRLAWFAPMAAALAATLVSTQTRAQTAPPPAAPAAAPAAAPPAAPPDAPTAKPQAAAAPAADTGTGSAPNMAVVVTGILGVVVWYVPGAVVAARSRIPSDGNLFAPIIGPWLDLADRPACGPGSISCRVETGNQVLLVADGIFQLWGVAATAIGLVSKDHARSPSALRVTPARIGSVGYGLSAVGTF